MPCVQAALGSDTVGSFAGLDRDFRAFLAVVDRHREASGILGRRQAHPGWREVQGDAMRRGLLRAANSMAALASRSHRVCEDVVCRKFPRFYLLSVADIVAIVAQPFKPEAALAANLRCFSGVVGFVCEAVAPDEYDSHMQADVSITALSGSDGTRLPLEPPVVLHKGGDVGEWQGAVVSRMQSALQEQVGCRLMNMSHRCMDAHQTQG